MIYWCKALCETGKKLSNYLGWWGRVIFCGDRSYI